MTQAVERRATIVARDGEKIYAEATGDGEPIVLCHGLGGNHAIWWQQIGAFARAALRYYLGPARLRQLHRAQRTHGHR